MTYGNPRWCLITGLGLGTGPRRGWVQALYPDDRTCRGGLASDARHRQAFPPNIVSIPGRQNHGCLAQLKPSSIPMASDRLSWHHLRHHRADAGRVTRRDHIHFLESLEKLDAALHASGDMDDLCSSVAPQRFLTCSTATAVGCPLPTLMPDMAHPDGNHAPQVSGTGALDTDHR